MRLLRVLQAALTTAAANAALPVPPLREAVRGSWPLAHAVECGGTGAYCGDVRAVLSVTESDITDGVAVAQIYWRRRDINPHVKRVIVLSPFGSVAEIVQATVEGTCGVVRFAAATPGLYAAYYLPFLQASGGADTTFTWQGCNSTDPTEANPCVLGDEKASAASVCDTVQPAAAALVLALEVRDAFNAFTRMEMMASPGEAAAAASAVASNGAPFAAVFPEDRHNSIRKFDGGIPVHWAMAAIAPGALNPAPFFGVAAPGEFVPFQLGVWAYKGSLANISAQCTGLTSNNGAPGIPASDVLLLTTAGVDIFGKAYSKPFSVESGAVGAAWIGVFVPGDAPEGTMYSGTVDVMYNHAVISAPASFTVMGPPAPFAGARNVSSLSRLSWLGSTRGLEDVVPAPFTPVAATQDGGTLIVSSLLKRVNLSATGLSGAITAMFPFTRAGTTRWNTFNMFRLPPTLLFCDAKGGSLPLTPLAKMPTLTSVTNSSLSWTASSSLQWSPSQDAPINVTVEGTLDFTSVLAFVVTLSYPGAQPAASIADMRLSFTLDAAVGRYMAGMGKEGSEARPFSWRWSNTTGTNRLWVGRPEAGMVLDLRDRGAVWDSPMFGKDYPVIPFLPTWAGQAQQPTGNPYGVDVDANGTVTVFTGPFSWTPGQGISFLFNLFLTPSKVVDWAKHWSARTVQVGYGTPYLTPQQVRGRGATVVTLHQGIPGVINGSLMNPYISYPFLPETVELLENYTTQAAELGMSTKFYYTVRELSTRAPETFAFLAQQGEIFVSQDPYVVVQPGYSHAWNAHGGSAYLHQHAGSRYAACWQQDLSDGEWDPALCDIGVSRLLNYYIEGLYWSMTQSPYISGVYYDGINFSRQSMARVRRTVEAASVAHSIPFPRLLDVHTGRDPTPPAASYAGIYPFMDLVWNGEGFVFSKGPAYWLVEVSSVIHGLSGDMLGAGTDDYWRGMLFGMVDRNSAVSTELWGFWDEVAINETSVMGWWEDEPVLRLNYTCGPSLAAAPQASFCPSWNHTVSSYFSSGTPCGSPNGNEGECFQGVSLAAAQTQCCGDPLCAGFSFAKSGSGGCYKLSATCPTKDASYDGWFKPSFTPPPDCNAEVLATVYSAYGSRAIVALASWCSQPTNVTFAGVDWESLGLDPKTTSASALAIPGLQSAAKYSSATGPFPLKANGGALVLLQ